MKKSFLFLTVVLTVVVLCTINLFAVTGAPIKINTFKASTIMTSDISATTTLSWGVVPNATSYEVIINNAMHYSVGANQLKLVNLRKKYFFKLIARNNLGEILAASSILHINNLIAGDVNFDRQVNSLDVDTVHKYLDPNIDPKDYPKELFNNWDPSSYIAADMDGDGVITANDETLLYNHVYGMSEFYPGRLVKQITYGDINGDSVVTAEDETMLLEYLAGVRTLTPPQKAFANVDEVMERPISVKIDMVDLDCIHRNVQVEDIIFSVMGSWLGGTLNNPL